MKTLPRTTVTVLLVISPILTASEAANEELAVQGGPLLTLTSDAFAFAPDGKSLAMVRDDWLWVAPCDDLEGGRGIVQFSAAHPIEQIDWTPDGDRIVFVSTRPGDQWGTIWSVKPDGSDVRDLLPPGCPFGSPGIRHVGIEGWASARELVFSTHCGTGCSELVALDIGHLTYSTICMAEGVTHWAREKNWGISATGHEGLSIAERSGTNRGSSDGAVSCRTLVPGVEPGRDPRLGTGSKTFLDWSPDATEFLYAARPIDIEQSRQHRDEATSIYAWNLATGSNRLIARGANRGAWSRDGSRIAVVGIEHDEKQAIVRLHILDRAGTHSIASVALGSPRPEDRGLPPAATFTEPVWSPDGRHVAVVDGPGDTVLVDADLTVTHLLTKRVPARVEFSPDGRRIALRIEGRFPKHPESSGFERYLPPRGKLDLARPVDEVVERYFQSFLKRTEPSASAIERSFVLADYADALRALGKAEKAAVVCREARALAATPGSGLSESDVRSRVCEDHGTRVREIKLVRPSGMTEEELHRRLSDASSKGGGTLGGVVVTPDLIRDGFVQVVKPSADEGALPIVYVIAAPRKE